MDPLVINDIALETRAVPERILNEIYLLGPGSRCLLSNIGNPIVEIRRS